jgi:hypothetical protein
VSAPVAGWIEELTRTVSSRLIAVEDDLTSSDEEVVARRRRESLRAFEKHLPPRFQWSRVDHPKFRARVSLPTIPLRPPDAMSVLLFGPSKAGKTTLAVALLRAMFEAKVAAHPFTSDDDIEAVARHCRFVPARRLGAAGTVPGDPLEIRRAMRVPVLLLDDLGQDADIKSNPVPAIIAERHDEERATWITTELTPSEILKRYGGGIARRICDGATTLRFGRP